jgi:hypothetical protein
MVVIVVIVILLAALGAYFVIINNASSHTNGSVHTTNSSHSGTTSSVTATTFTSKRSSTDVSGLTTGISTYSGTFNFSLALGPSGERVSSNNTVETYSSVEAGSGSFTFFISAVNKSGSGSGHGTFSVTTTGFCSGRTEFAYTFQIPDATALLGNLTVFIGTPTPSSYTVPLSCSGSLNGVNTATNNPGTFLAIYPNELSVSSVPANVNQHQSAGINYSYTIT